MLAKERQTQLDDMAVDRAKILDKFAPKEIPSGEEPTGPSGD